MNTVGDDLSDSVVADCEVTDCAAFSAMELADNDGLFVDMSPFVSGIVCVAGGLFVATTLSFTGSCRDRSDPVWMVDADHPERLLSGSTGNISFSLVEDSSWKSLADNEVTGELSSELSPIVAGFLVDTLSSVLSGIFTVKSVDSRSSAIREDAVVFVSCEFFIVEVVGLPRLTVEKPYCVCVRGAVDELLAENVNSAFEVVLVSAI